jgi:hypothetical protein
MEALVVFSFLSFMVTKSVDVVRNGVDLKDTFPKVVWNAVSFGFGFLYAFLFDLSIFEAFGVAHTSGVILTGFTLGGGGSFGHELLDMLSARGHSPQPPA